jgi:aspartokinase/homoserine dehydrogenase 1
VILAFAAVTDLLVEASKKAALKDNEYKRIVAEIEYKHLDAIKVLIPIHHQNRLK